MEMTVTAVSPFRGKGSRYAIYLNDEFAFVLYKGELSQYGLEDGATVDDALYERILGETLIPRARKRGMSLLQSMDRTESDVRSKLSDGGYPREAIDDAIEYLKSFHYIDDDRYAYEYIRFKTSSMSRRQISTKLASKGIDKDTIERSFEAYYSDNECDGKDTERALIARLIAKRCPQGVDALDYNGIQKLRAYLYGKGFSVGSIEEYLRS